MIANSFWLRQFLQNVAQFFELEEPAVRQLDFVPERKEERVHAITIKEREAGVDPDPPVRLSEMKIPGHFNNWDSPWTRLKRPSWYKHRSSGGHLPFKGAPRRLPPEAKTALMLHQTGVEFGTSNRRRKFWYRFILPNRSLLEESGFLVPPPEDVEGLDILADRLALHERFWKVPYHFIGASNGDVIYNNHVLNYTYHGGLGNTPCVGVACDARLPGLARNYNPEKHSIVDDFWMNTQLHTIDVAMHFCREDGLPIRHLVVHRNYSKNRKADPGEQYMKDVAVHAARRHDLEILQDFKVGEGLATPWEWSDQGVVDFKGRRVR